MLLIGLVALACARSRVSVAETLSFCDRAADAPGAELSRKLATEFMRPKKMTKSTPAKYSRASMSIILVPHTYADGCAQSYLAL